MSPDIYWILLWTETMRCDISLIPMSDTHQRAVSMLKGDGLMCRLNLGNTNNAVCNCHLKVSVERLLEYKMMVVFLTEGLSRCWGLHQSLDVPVLSHGSSSYSKRHIYNNKKKRTIWYTVMRIIFFGTLFPKNLLPAKKVLWNECILQSSRKKQEHSWLEVSGLGHSPLSFSIWVRKTDICHSFY